MDFQIPLNRLKFGQDAGAGINARTAGRLDDIEPLAANIFAQSRTDKLAPRKGLIENLIVKPLDGGFFGVSNGNRRLAALHQIHGADSDEEIPCTSHEVDDADALEQSLITAVTARQLHPVDQYENFARLEERKTHEEIAQQYGLTEKEVRQALVLGKQLSPKIREAWRAGVIKAEVAKAFTLGCDHKTQDKLYKQLEKAGHLYEHVVRRELGADNSQGVAEILAFVGADAYRARGGSVVEDLFRKGSIVSDGALLKTMLAEALEAKCEELRAEGWKWVAQLSELGEAARYWPQILPKKLDYQGDEEEQLKKMEAKLDAAENGDQDLATADLDHDEAFHQLHSEIENVKLQVRQRSFTEAQRKRTGCIVEFDDDEGVVKLLVGIDKPEPVAATAAKPKASKSETGEAEPEVEEPAISQALMHRLSLQLTEGAATALSQDVGLALIVLLAGFASKHSNFVKISVNGVGAAALDLTGTIDLPGNIAMVKSLSLQDRMALIAPIAAAGLDFQHRSFDRDDGRYLGTICNEMDPASLNAALRGAFDAKDYFANVSKPILLQAIREALGDDVARQQANQGKPSIVAFALENVPPTGWLPVQLRAKGYDGPPVVKASPAPSIEAPAPEEAPPVKKAAAAKKAAKKTSAKVPAKKAASKKKKA